MSEDTPDDIVSLAEEYLDSLDDDGGSKVNLDEAQEELEYWEEQMDEFEEGTTMHEMAVEERDEWREKLEAVDALGEQREELRTELLSRASTEFAPKEDWLEPVTVEALSHALIERRLDELLVDKYSLPRDADELSKHDMVDVAKTVQALARDAIGEDERIVKLWDALDTETRRSVTEVLARHQEPLSSPEISDEIGEDGTDDPGSTIRYLRGQVDIQPYYSTDNGYALSLVGRYVWKEYGPDTPEPASEDDEAEGDQGASEDGEADEAQGISEDDEADTDDEQGGGKEVDLSSFDIRE